MDVQRADTWTFAFSACGERVGIEDVRADATEVAEVSERSEFRMDEAGLAVAPGWADGGGIVAVADIVRCSVLVVCGASTGGRRSGSEKAS